MENEKRTNDTRKRYEISVNLNDPGSVTTLCRDWEGHAPCGIGASKLIVAH
jgi:hypothetical protein